MLQYTPYRGSVLGLAKIPFQIASRWDFRRKTRDFREKAVKNISSFEEVCTLEFRESMYSCRMILIYIMDLYTLWKKDAWGPEYEIDR